MFKAIILFTIAIFSWNIISSFGDIQRPRCPNDFDEKHKMTKERENEIYDDILNLSKSDEIVRELLIQSGRVPPQSTLRGNELSVTVYTFPVIFHVFMSGAIGSVPEESFQKQITAMNVAYKRAGIMFSFDSIKTYENSNYFNCENNEDAMKMATGVSNEKYLNVWVCNPSYLGMATFPWEYDETSKLHGLVLSYLTLPTSPGYTPYENFNEGDTLVHEVGHFLGLFHTFQGGCKSKDFVKDTAPERSPAYGKPCLKKPARDTCSSKGVDPITNFMDYTDDFCMDNFTPLQNARMRSMLLKYKKGIQ